MKTLIRGLAGIVLAGSVIGGGCEDDPADLINPPDTFSLNVTLINEDLVENIHIFRDVFEDFSPANRLEPGGSRTLTLTDLEDGDRVTWIAGRNGERFDEEQCTANDPSAAVAPPGVAPAGQALVRVFWGGDPLSPSLRCDGWGG